MKSINEILRDYTAGEVDLEATNAVLKETGAPFHLEPGKNVLTDADRRETSVGYYPEQANGWGLLDTGTGTPDKVRVNYGRLNSAVNEVLPDGSVNMKAYVTVCGKTYAVLGDKLAEVEPRPKGEPGRIGPKGEPAPNGKPAPLPLKADLSRRTDLAGQMVDQYTKSGTYRVTYDMQGYAIRAVKLEVQ